MKRQEKQWNILFLDGDSNTRPQSQKYITKYDVW